MKDNEFQNVIKKILPNVKGSSRIIDNTIKYEDKYSKIIVTYHDNVTKEFLPYQWAIFEKGIRKISKKIEFIKK